MMYQSTLRLSPALCGESPPMRSVSFGRDYARAGFKHLNSDGKCRLVLTSLMLSVSNTCWLWNSMARNMQSARGMSCVMRSWSRGVSRFCVSGTTSFFSNMTALWQLSPSVAGSTGEKLPSSGLWPPSPAGGRRPSPAPCRIRPFYRLREKVPNGRMRALK